MVYQFSDGINYDVFFRFDKKWIEDMNWAMLPKASKAVFPVIAVHCNADGEAFPSEVTIAILSGLREKAVREGIRGLLGFPGFQLNYYATRHGRRAKKFKLDFPPRDEKGRSFFFYKAPIEGGNWGQLKEVSQALYPVMRFYGFFDLEIYQTEEEGADDADDFESLYAARKWDICEAEIPLMQRHAGISRQSAYLGLADLKEHCLIEPLEGFGDGSIRKWKVFIKPPKWYKREYLNQRTMAKFIKKDDCPKLTGHGV